MLACTALVGCNNEDVVNNDVKNGEEYYAVVSFSMPGNTSRAASLDGFEHATDDEEIKVNNAMFYFLDDAGKSVADACYIANTQGGFNWETNTVGTTGDNVNALTNSVIVMRNPTDIPSRIVALINVGKLELSTNRPSLEQLQSVVGSYATDTHTAIPTDGMVMSSTSYLDATGAVTIGAPVSANNIFESEEELKKKVGDLAEGAMADVAVVIPVEKVLAKVTVAQSPNFVQDEETTTLGSLTDAGTSGNAATATTNDVQLTVEINGWWLDSTPTHSYLLKDINNVNVGNWWNDLANTRSYWANSYEGDEPAQGYANDQYGTQASIGNSLYTQENTSMPTDKPEQGNDGEDNVYDGNNRTKVVVAATLKNGNSAVSLVKWYGNYYTKEGFLISLANLNDVKKYYIKTTSDEGNTYTSLTKDNLQIVANTDKDDAGTEIGTGNQNNVVVNNEEIRNYEAAVKLADNVTELYVVNSNGEFEAVESLDDVNTELLNISKIQYWKDGKTYYYVEIEHNYDSATETTYYGVVRNHLYKLTLDGVKGLGTPVPNPDKIIIPEKPADTYSETYISANIQILAYKVVSNNVTLE